MTKKSLPCPVCVTWTCSECDNPRSRMDARWVNPYCARCKGTTGVRTGVRHRNVRLKERHQHIAATWSPDEIIREDGMIFRWPAPFLDEVPKPGVMRSSDVLLNPQTEPKHPDGTCATPHLLGRSFVVMSHLVAADVAKSTEAGTVTWSELLLVRVLAALSVSDPRNIRHHLQTVTELIEDWTEELDRRIG